MVAVVLTPDGIRLQFQAVGKGPTVVFAHEFGGDSLSWGPQLAALSGTFRCVVYDARGYSPSDVPPDQTSYSQELASSDLLSIVDGLAIRRTHLVGLSMGAYACLYLALAHPERVASLTLASIGYGTDVETLETFRAECRANAEIIRTHGIEAFADTWGRGPTRRQLERKDPAAFTSYLGRFRGHSSVGSANTIAGVQGTRPSLAELEEQLGALAIPTMILLGDEDEPARAGSLLLASRIRGAGLAVFPWSGHLLNLEEPALFNDLVRGFVGRTGM